MSDAPTPLRLGRFSVVQRLGVGGMAEVFLARSRGAEGVDKSLVVKRILPEYAENPQFRAMFVDEARVALRLNHPNIVQVYGFENDGSALLLIMEHIDGPDLGLLSATASKSTGPISPSIAAYIAREVARGLHYAHERVDDQGHPLEIVHRDVSPTNVLLSYEGAVKLGDFGIAHARSASFREEGLVQGKFGYMAPEQARGERVDRRADLWALGIVLGEVLLGRSWFAGVRSADQLLDRVRRADVPDPNEVLCDTPAPLREVVSRCLQAHPADRFSTAKEISLSLTQYLHALEDPADALAVEQFVSRVLPRKTPAASARLSSRPPPPLDARAPLSVPAAISTAEPAPTVSGFNPISAVTLPELIVVSGTPALRAPRVEPLALVRDRTHVVVISGRATATLAVSESRALIALIDALAFKADATLDWHGETNFTLLLGALHPHVDNALRAARLALDIADAARSLAVDAETFRAGSAPQDQVVSALSLGLTRGVAGCSRDPEGNLIACELIDDASAQADVLASLARPGEILVASPLARIVRRVFSLKEHPARTGSSARPWLLERMKSRAERDRSAEAMGLSLLGRESALQELLHAHAMATPSGAACLVLGEPGVGKSTVLGALEHVLTTAQSPTPAILRIEGSFGATAIPYGLAAQLVRHLVTRQVARHRAGDPALPPVEALSDRLVLSSVLDSVLEHWSQSAVSRRAALRALRVCLGLELDEDGAEAATTRELAMVLRPMISEVAAETTAVILADGLDVADPQSRALLADLARRPPSASVLIVMALRNDDPLEQELASVPAIRLSGLDLEARRRLIALALGADTASDELVREVSAVAGGNPLTVLEVVETLSERDRVRARADDTNGELIVDLLPRRGEDLTLPATLGEVFSARIDTLSPDARAVLRWVSLCESELGSEVLDPLSGPDGSRVRARLVAEGLLVDSGSRVSFAHSALAEVVRGSIDPTALPALHATIAELIEKLDKLDAKPSRRVVLKTALARHREAAGAVRLAARAWADAAAAMPQLGKTEETLGAYGRVLVLCEGATDREGVALRAAAHAGREELARLAGRTTLRREELLGLRAAAAQSGEARLIAQALVRQARYKLDATPGAELSRDVAAAVRSARRAGEASFEAEARWVLALHLKRRGKLAEGLEQSEHALEVIDRSPGVRESRNGGALRIEVLLARASMLRRLGRWREGLRAAAEAWALAQRQGHRRALGGALDELGMMCLSQNAPTEALRYFRAAIAADREVGERVRIGVSLAHAGEALWALHEAGRAKEYSQGALVVMERAVRGGASALVRTHTVLAELALARGDVEAAAADVARARVRAEALGWGLAMVGVLTAEARVHLARRQFRQARLVAEAAERAAQEAGMVDEVVWARAFAAAAAARVGDKLGAQAWIEAVLSDPRMAEPARMARCGDVLRACAMALSALNEPARGAALEEYATMIDRAVAETWRSAKQGEKQGEKQGGRVGR